MDPGRLGNVAIFSDLTKAELERVSRWTDEVSVPEGYELAREGQFAHEFFIIEDGAASVVANGDRIAELGAGDFFGEIGLLETERRTASVVATTPMELIVMFEREFRQMERGMPFGRDPRPLGDPRAPRKSRSKLVGAAQAGLRRERSKTALHDKSRKSQVVIAVTAASLAGPAQPSRVSHTHSNTLRTASAPAAWRDARRPCRSPRRTSALMRASSRRRSGAARHSHRSRTRPTSTSTDGLVDALVAAAQKNIAADVSSGRLAQSQADQILSGLKQHITERVSSTGPPGGPHGRSGPHGGLDAAASYLGLSETDLITQLQAGKTLGEIAGVTSGKSKAGLIAALVADGKSQLTQAVKDGHLDPVAGRRDCRGHRSQGDGPRERTAAGHAPSGPPPPDTRSGRIRACRILAALLIALAAPEAARSSQKPIPFGASGARRPPPTRTATTACDTWRLSDPHVIVEHYTAGSDVLVGLEHVRARHARRRAPRAAGNVRALRDRPRRDDLPARAADDDLPPHRGAQLDARSGSSTSARVTPRSSQPGAARGIAAPDALADATATASRCRT